MRAIEENKITRVGGTTSIPIDIRIIAASNRNLEQMVQDGTLRHDFYHRLNVVNIHVPSLASRRDDIPALVKQFIMECNERYNREIQGFDNVSIQRLCEADWPGNVRELRNTIERCVIMADGQILHWEGDKIIRENNENQPVIFSEDKFFSLTQLEQEYINHVLKCFNGKKNKAAQILGIDKTTLWRKLRRYENDSEAV
jgi:DNA-binding NtrC family response regulator